MNDFRRKRKEKEGKGRKRKEKEGKERFERFLNEKRLILNETRTKYE